MGEVHPFVDLVKTTRGFYNLAGRLASNGAVDFAHSDSNGWPTEDFTFCAADNAEWGEIRVTDSGPGIAAAEREAIFQPYYRSEGTADLPGIGLGQSRYARFGSTPSV